MFNSPYETTSLQNHITKDIVSDIQKEMVRNPQAIQRVTNEQKQVYPIYGVYPFAEHINAFTQPLLGFYNDDPWFFIDMRPYTKVDRIGDIIVSSSTDYKIQSLYGTLCSAWYNNGVSLFARLSAFPGKIFVNWISNAITRALSLDMISQVQLKNILGLYYEGLHHFYDGVEDSLVLGERDLKPIHIAVAKYSYSTPIAVSQQLDGVSMPINITGLIDVLHKQNPRFEALTTANLYAMLARSWFGVNAPTMCAVALEYPPAFFTMVYFALTHKGFNKTAIGNIVYNDRNSQEAKQFLLGIDKLLDDALI